MQKVIHRPTGPVSQIVTQVNVSFSEQTGTKYDEVHIRRVRHGVIMTRTMPGEPLKRIYFDTNWLRRWPNPANNVSAVIRAANWMDTELYIPETVEDELENQFLRDTIVAYANASAGVKDLRKLFRNVIDIEYELPRPSDELLRKAFRARSAQLKEYFRISSIPLVEIPTKKLVEMAIRRQAPFEQHAIAKDRNVVAGLQDAAILFSVIEHLKGKSAGRNGFVTNDAIFHQTKTQELIAEHGATLEMFRSLDVLFDDLYDNIWDVIKSEWHNELEQINRELNAQKAALGGQILPLLRVSELAAGYKSVKELKSLTVEAFAYARTALPSVEYRPPSVATYTRPEGSTVEITAVATVQAGVIVEQYSFLDALLNTGPKQPQVTPDARVEEMTLSARLKVSITGIMRNARVTDFNVTDVQVEK